MKSEVTFKILEQKELNHQNIGCHWLMIVAEKQQYYLAIHFNQAAVVYKRIDNLLAAKIILTKLHQKLLRVKNYNKLNSILLRAFRFGSLYQSLFFINLFGIKKIQPYYIEVLTKRYNLRGNSYFTFDVNNQIENSIIEVRFPPKNELFGILISMKNENYFRFQMHRMYKRILRAQ